jgi:hypothetical protein
MSTNDIHQILEPSGTLRVANATAHCEISFDDIFWALVAMRRADLSNGILQTNLCTKLFGNDSVASWKGDKTLVAKAALAQRNRVQWQTAMFITSSFTHVFNSVLNVFQTSGADHLVFKTRCPRNNPGA